MGTKFEFEKVMQNIQVMKVTLPVKLANVTRTHFVDSFKQQGWNGHPWKPSLKKTGTTMIKSGALRRAVNNSIRTTTFERVQLIVDLPYAEIHNEGGVINKSERDHVLHFSKGGGFSKVAKASYAQKVKIGAHSINMPQRQFMGQSDVLTNLQLLTINKAINKVWQE